MSSSDIHPRNPILSRIIVQLGIFGIVFVTVLSFPFSLRWSSVIPSIAVGILATRCARVINWQSMNILYRLYNSHKNQIILGYVKSTILVGILLIYFNNYIFRISDLIGINSWFALLLSSLILGIFATPFSFFGWLLESIFALVLIAISILTTTIMRHILLIVENSTVAFQNNLLQISKVFILTVLFISVLESTKLIIDPEFHETNSRNSFTMKIKSGVDEEVISGLSRDFEKKYEMYETKWNMEKNRTRDPIRSDTISREVDYNHLYNMRYECTEISDRLDNLSPESRVRIVVEDDADFDENSGLREITEK